MSHCMHENKKRIFRRDSLAICVVLVAENRDWQLRMSDAGENAAAASSDAQVDKQGILVAKSHPHAQQWCSESW